MSSAEPGLTDNDLEALIRNHPRAYRGMSIRAVEDLESALRVTCAPVAVTWHEALRRYRDSQVNEGILGTVTIGLLHPVVMDRARKLDEVLILIKAFKPEEFMTEGMISQVSRRAANVRRPNAQTREAKLDEIGVWLKRKNYEQSVDKAGLMRQATIKFNCGETDVKDAARRAGLTRKYRQSSK